MIEVLRVALTSIRGNLFRASLTMLGVIIGVAAVITMLALGTGGTARGPSNSSMRSART